MKNKKTEVTEKNKGFVWKALRLGFWGMIGCWVLSVLISMSQDNIFWTETEPLGGLFVLVWFGLVIFTFVISIIHLTKFKQKKLAITALVLSSYLILTFLVGFLWGVMDALASAGL